MRLDAEFGGDGRPLDHAREAGAVSGAPRSDANTNGDCSLSRRCLRNARIPGRSTDASPAFRS